MKVVLIDEAPGLGIAGDVREVKDGYARNFLFPKGLAVLATPQELARADSRKKAEIERRTKLNLEMESVGERLAEERLLIAVRVGPGGRLYGSVTTTEIAEAVNEAMGVEIDRRAVQLAQPIRELGHHQTPIRLAPDVIPSVTITVYQEGTDPPPLVEETPEEEQEGAETAEATAAEATAEAVDAPEATAEEAEAVETEEEAAEVAEEEAETAAPDEPEAEAPQEDEEESKE
ncbi:MAG: 50S ribosomal protein L9 [Dehalococcoidia bacterium]|nr:50S ribosomal protein L9 [Dehalococcoidia bacterium]